MDSRTGISADLTTAGGACAVAPRIAIPPSADIAVGEAGRQRSQVAAQPPVEGAPSSDRRDTLPRNEFLHHLNSEKRRSERTKLPLSIVLFRPQSGISPGGRETHRLLETLHRIKRETDILGHCNDGGIAVLCTGTDKPGAAGFVAKLADVLGDHRYEVVAATYPDTLFQLLAEGARTPAVLEPLLVRAVPDDGCCSHPLKRFVDIVGAMAALVLLSPIIIVFAAIVAYTSRGPVIFRQTRCGAGGVPFTFYKFRSMYVDGDDHIHRAFVANLIREEAADDKVDGSKPPLYKLHSDPRVTPIGRFMRKSSIDELPQLFNVLKGDMSLVGPRPPIPYETAHYQSWHLRRILSAKPGMTGLWQVQGRSNVKFNEMVRMDIRYCQECSLLLDLKILLKTIGVVIRCSGSF